MAGNQDLAYVMVALLLFAVATPLAHAQPPVLGQWPGNVTVSGVICCTYAGNCPGGSPLSGVPVRLVCSIGGVTATVAQGATGVNGTFIVTVPNLLSTVLFGPIGGNIPPQLCRAVVDLPINQTLCLVLNIAAGILVGNLWPPVGLILPPPGFPPNNYVVRAFVRVG